MQNILGNSSDKAKIFYLFLFSLAGSFIASSILILVVGVRPEFENSIWYYRLSIVLQDAFMLFLPAYTIYKWITDNPMRMLGIKKDDKMLWGIFYTLLIFWVSTPMVSILAKWNEQLVFPESMKNIENWMRQMEDAALQTTDLFLSGKTALDLMLNLLIIAAAAAFVEEIFFRGALQQLLEKWTRNGHLAVWIAALVFSAIHLQFYGFFPRLLMGAILGYLFLYSRNLWIPILYHFVNNASVVVVKFFWGNQSFVEKLEEERSPTWAYAVIMAVSLMLTYYLFSRYKKQLKKNDSN